MPVFDTTPAPAPSVFPISCRRGQLRWAGPPGRAAVWTCTSLADDARYLPITHAVIGSCPHRAASPNAASTRPAASPRTAPSFLPLST